MTFSSISDLWNKWNIRGFMLLSLSLQFFLFLFAPFRKRTTNECIIFLLWLAYLMADCVAVFALGLISHNQGNSCACVAELDRALQASWASFLLLHLGGPDTITAFSLEDSSLWRRHLLSFIFQVGVVIYVFVQIFPNDKSLVIPTMLVFLAGVIKNAERTLALTLSRITMLKKHAPAFSLVEPWKQLDVLRDGYSDEEEAKLAESIVVKHAYPLFLVAVVFIEDFMFIHSTRELCREYFHKISAMDALRVMSVELHFIYEILYTKALVIHSKLSYIVRFIAFTGIAMAFVLFNCSKKHRLPKVDLEITYSLFFGAIALDVIALFKLVFSEWTVVNKHERRDRDLCDLHPFLSNLVSAIYDLRKPRFATCRVEPNANVTYAVLDTPLIFRRWSESISACNLISEILEESPRKMYKLDNLNDDPRKIYKCGGCLGIFGCSNICSIPLRMAKEIISCFHQAGYVITDYCSPNVSMKYVSKNPFIKKLWIFIFKEVRRKARNADNPTEVMKIFESRGNLFLERRLGDIDCGNLSVYVTEATYDESILVWHLATEMWYNREKITARHDEREFSKILSDYVLYLLLNQSHVVSAVVGIVQVRLTETLEELRIIIRNRASKDVERACMDLFEHGGRQLGPEYPRSAVFKGIKLAEEMGRLGEKKWEVMSGVWVEMLSFAATHIKGEAHVQVLSNGGQLLAFVWLLMIHFGCFYKPGLGMYYGFQVDETHPDWRGRPDYRHGNQ